MVDINKPDLIIRIKDLSKPIDISKILSSIGDKSYTYAFKCQGMTIKIGMSDNSTNTPGERVYRQIANLPGWPVVPASDSGKDMISAVAAFEEKEDIVVHKDDCTIEFWISGIRATDDENELLTQYKDFNGCLPPGNIKDTRGKGFVSIKVFNKFFDVVE